MTITIIVISMACLILVARSSRTFGRREWMWAIAIALFQLTVALHKMFTMDMPPLY